MRQCVTVLNSTYVSLGTDGLSVPAYGMCYIYTTQITFQKFRNSLMYRQQQEHMRLELKYTACDMTRL